LNSPISDKYVGHFWRYVVAVSIIWTAVIGGSLIWNFHILEKHEGYFLNTEPSVNITNDPRSEALKVNGLSHLAIWLLGLSGVGYGSYRIRRHLEKNIRTESALRMSEERLRGAINSLQEGLALFDADDKLIAFNPQYERLRPGVRKIMERGGSFEDMVRENVKSGNILEALGREEEFIAERIRSHRGSLEPVIRQFKDGQWYLLHENHTPEGGAAVSFTNVTELKQAEELARKSETRFKEIFALAPEAVITIGEDLKIQLFNQGAERIFGYRAEQIVGSDIHVLLPERFRSSHLIQITEFENSSETFRLKDERRQIIGLRKDGMEFPAAASVSKLDLGGEKIYTVVMQDISQRLNIEENLRTALVDAEQANQSKSEFLATMSHELRTPLNAIIGFSGMMAEQYYGQLGSQKYVEYADDICTSSEHLLNLVNDILDLSAIEAGESNLNKINLNMSEVVSNCIAIIAEAASVKNITLQTEYDANLPLLYVDRRSLKQIVLNLLSNSIKYSRENGSVLVKLSVIDGFHQLMIKDTGTGIPEDMLSDITAPFTKVDSDPYHTEEGSGLGLAIVSKLVALHEGDLIIESEIDVGSNIMVRLPSKKSK
jgi:PAS domain S-box-containing protein